MSVDLEALFAEVQREKEDLHGYQWEIVDFAEANPFSFILADAGLGKTVSMLTLLDRLMSRFDDGEIEHALIVAPLRVARNTWPRELAKWRHAAGWPYTLIRAEMDDPEVLKAQRDAYREARDFGSQPAQASSIAGLAATAAKNALRDRLRLELKPITIINQEAVPWLVDAWGKKWPYDCLIFDEATRLRDHGSLVFDKLKFVRPRFKRIHLLTATPAVQSLMPLFAMTYMLDGGQRFTAYITKYRKKYFDHNPYTKTYEEKGEAREQIMGKIADISLVMREKDHFQIEEPIIIRRPVYMTEDEKKAYRVFEREMILTTPTGDTIEASNAAHLAQKLLQLASGTVYDTTLERIDGLADNPDEEDRDPWMELLRTFQDRIDRFDLTEEDAAENADKGTLSQVYKKIRKTHFLHEHKINDLRQLVDELEGQPLLIAYWSQASLVLMRQAFPKLVVLDRKASQERAWNKGQIPLLAVHPQGAAHGLNLQEGGHHLYAFDLFHSGELWIQLLKRLARQGQKNIVKVHMPTTMGTLDEDTADKLMGLDEGHNDFMEKLRRRIRAARMKGRDNA